MRVPSQFKRLTKIAGVAAGALLATEVSLAITLSTATPSQSPQENVAPEPIDLATVDPQRAAIQEAITTQIRAALTQNNNECQYREITTVQSLIVSPIIIDFVIGLSGDDLDQDCVMWVKDQLTAPNQNTSCIYMFDTYYEDHEVARAILETCQKEKRTCPTTAIIADCLTAFPPTTPSDPPSSPVLASSSPDPEQ